MRHYLFTFWICALCLAFVVGPARAAESSETAYLQDRAQIFLKLPEQRARIEAMLQNLAREHNFHCFLITEKNLFGDSINVIARQQCTKFVGARSGCVMLFEESSKNFHLSSPISVGNFEASAEQGPYVSAAWLEDQFLVASRKTIEASAEIEPHDYLEKITWEITQLLDQQFTPTEKSHLWITFITITAGLLVLYLIGQFLARRNDSSLTEEQLEFHFPTGTVTQRLSAKYGGGMLITRQWMGTSVAAIDPAQSVDFFLQASNQTPKPRKRLIGKATIFELLCKIRDKEFTEQQVCEKYEITPSFLVKWREHFAPQLELSHSEEMVEKIKKVLSTMIDDKMSDFRGNLDEENGPSAEMIEMIKDAITEAIQHSLPPPRLIPDHLREEVPEKETPAVEPKSLPVMPI